MVSRGHKSVSVVDALRTARLGSRLVPSRPGTCPHDPGRPSVDAGCRRTRPFPPLSGTREASHVKLSKRRSALVAAGLSGALLLSACGGSDDDSGGSGGAAAD